MPRVEYIVWGNYNGAWVRYNFPTYDDARLVFDFLYHFGRRPIFTQVIPYKSPEKVLPKRRRLS